MRTSQEVECKWPLSRVLFCVQITLRAAMVIHLGVGLLRRSSDTSRSRGRTVRGDASFDSILLQVGFTDPQSHQRGSVSSYLTLSPLPHP